MALTGGAHYRMIESRLFNWPPSVVCQIPRGCKTQSPGLVDQATPLMSKFMQPQPQLQTSSLPLSISCHSQATRKIRATSRFHEPVEGADQTSRGQYCFKSVTSRPTCSCSTRPCCPSNDLNLCVSSILCNSTSIRIRTQ